MPRGRPRSFDRDEVLRKAMYVFWEHGYEGASVSELTAAMGISSPSLYAAFGDKEMLFLEALRLYGTTAGSLTMRALREQPTARKAMESMLRDNAAEYLTDRHPRGCMIALAATMYAPSNHRLHKDLARMRDEVLGQVRERVVRGVLEGDVPSGSETDAIGAFYYSVLLGLSIRARDGAELDELNAVVNGAMAAWEVLTRGNRAKGSAAARSRRARNYI